MKIDFIDRLWRNKGEKFVVCDICGNFTGDGGIYYTIGDDYGQTKNLCPDCAAKIFSRWIEKKTGGEIEFYDKPEELKRLYREVYGK